MSNMGGMYWAYYNTRRNGPSLVAWSRRIIGRTNPLVIMSICWIDTCFERSLNYATFRFYACMSYMVNTINGTVLAAYGESITPIAGLLTVIMHKLGIGETSRVTYHPAGTCNVTPSYSNGNSLELVLVILVLVVVVVVATIEWLVASVFTAFDMTERD